MNVFFLGSWGKESERGTNKSSENRFAIYSPMNPEKKTHSLNEFVGISGVIKVLSVNLYYIAVEIHTVYTENFVPVLFSPSGLRANSKLREFNYTVRL